MLQQLHGVTMYSHDEHHTTTPYCWSERGKGASATTAVHLNNIRSSVSQHVLRPVALFHLKHTRVLAHVLKCGSGPVSSSYK